jgi:hypothetical protein
MIEHFSKWLELVPLPNRSSEGAAYAFLDIMFSRFGVPTKVLEGISKIYVRRH